MIRAVRRPRPRYYSWTIVWTLAVTETVSWGILYYAFAVFLVPMQTELGWSTPQITGAYSLALVVTMILSPPVGHWLDRAGPRVPMTIGSVLGTILLVAWSRVESLGAFYLIWAGIGAALALTLYEPAFAAASTWFVRGRSRALLILTTVAGLASTIFLPVAGWLIERLGWREALLILALILGVTTIPAHALVLRRRPQDLGLLPDGELAAPGQPSPPPEGVTIARALRDPAYWWLNGAFFLGMTAAVAIGVYLIPILLERGESLARATFITGLIGAAQVGGRVAITALDRRVPEAAMGVTVFALQAIALAVILATSGLALTLLAVALLGAGRGGVTLMRATLVADRYGRANFAAISGIPAAAQMAARAVAPVGAGLLITWLGGYTPMLAVLAVIALAATLAMVIFALSARPLRIDDPAEGHASTPVSL
jgi:predicted MFS family arabinose efflux permease